MNPIQSTYRKIKYQIIPLQVTASGQTVTTAGITVDQNYGRVVGIQATCTLTTPFQKSFFKKFEIGSKEIYPNGFEAKMIAGGQDCPVKERFDNDVDEPGAGATVNIEYTDSNAAVFAAYTVYVYLKLENPTK